MRRTAGSAQSPKQNRLDAWRLGKTQFGSPVARQLQLELNHIILADLLHLEAERISSKQSIRDRRRRLRFRVLLRAQQIPVVVNMNRTRLGSA